MWYAAILTVFFHHAAIEMQLPETYDVPRHVRGEPTELAQRRVPAQCRLGMARLQKSFLAKREAFEARYGAVVDTRFECRETNRT